MVCSILDLAVLGGTTGRTKPLEKFPVVSHIIYLQCAIKTACQISCSLHARLHVNILASRCWSISTLSLVRPLLHQHPVIWTSANIEGDDRLSSAEIFGLPVTSVTHCEIPKDWFVRRFHLAPRAELRKTPRARYKAVTGADAK